MAETYDTAMSLLGEASSLLATAAEMCESDDDAAALTELSARIAGYLASSRSSTMLGMPRITPSDNRLSDEMVRHRETGGTQGHVRILPA